MNIRLTAALVLSLSAPAFADTAAPSPPMPKEKPKNRMAAARVMHGPER